MFVTEVLPPNVLLVPVQSSYSNEIAMKKPAAGGHTGMRCIRAWGVQTLATW